ncbi:MAG: cation-transporting P-type ATPase [Pirellulaceae bacterium]
MVEISTDRIQQVSPDAVYTALLSRTAGLQTSEVIQRQRQFGLNCIRSVSGYRWLRILAKHAGNFFSVLLVVAAGFCFLAESLQPGQGMNLIGWALLGVAVLNMMFAFAQEMRAERAMEELQKLLPQRVTVRRSGQVQELDAENLVPGDVIMLRR